MLYLWAPRWSVARGWHWSQERAVTESTAPQWLKAYQGDAPNIKFLVARKRPTYRIEKESTQCTPTSNA